MLTFPSKKTAGHKCETCERACVRNDQIQPYGELEFLVRHPKFELRAQVRRPSYVLSPSLAARAWIAKLVPKILPREISTGTMTYIVDATTGEILRRSEYVPSGFEAVGFKRRETKLNLEDDCKSTANAETCRFRVVLPKKTVKTLAKGYDSIGSAWKTIAELSTELHIKNGDAESLDAPLLTRSKSRKYGEPHGGGVNSADRRQQREKAGADAFYWLADLLTFLAEEYSLCILSNDKYESITAKNEKFRVRACADISAVVSSEQGTGGPRRTRADASSNALYFFAAHKTEDQLEGVAKNDRRLSDASDPIMVAHELAHLLIRSLNRMHPDFEDVVFSQCSFEKKSKGEQWGALDESLADVLGTLLVLYLRGEREALDQWGLFGIGSTTRNDEDVRWMNKKLTYSQINQDKMCQKGRRGVGVRDNSVLYEHARLPNFVAYHLIINPPVSGSLRHNRAWYKALLDLYISVLEEQGVCDGGLIEEDCVKFWGFMERMYAHLKYPRDRGHRLRFEGTLRRIEEAWEQVEMCVSDKTWQRKEGRCVSVR